jgi:hypothetical protein
MRRALGLAPRAARIEITEGLMVTLSVRAGGGITKRYVRRTQSILRHLAIIEAEQAARREGYTPWALLDVE